jgi:hypothetical protein
MKFVIRKDDNVKTEHQFIDDYYDMHTFIILNNIGRPRYAYIDGEKENKVCRFCGKTDRETTFENKSHVVPKFLGNFLVLSNFECDVCNAYFSRYETELEKYVKIPLIANKNDQLKDRTAKNISRINGVIERIGEKEIVEFNSISVLKIFLKFAYSMLLDDELKDYTHIKKILLNEDLPRITNVMDITLRKPFEFNTIVLYKSKDPDFIDNILTLNFNMKKYVIFFHKDENRYPINERILRNQYMELFGDLDIYSGNPRVRDFNTDNYTIKFNIDSFLKLLDL